MVTTRRSIVAAMLGAACVAFVMFHPSVVDRSDRVASADEHVRIDAPADGTAVTGRIDIRVTVRAVDSVQIDFYRVYVGNGRSPSAMRPLGPPRTTAVESEVVATLDSTLLQAGEATIELRLYPKDGDPIDARVVVVVQVGPTPTRTFSGPVITVPPVAVAPPQAVPASGAPASEYPVAVLPDVEIPPLAPMQPTPIPV